MVIVAVVVLVIVGVAAVRLVFVGSHDFYQLCARNCGRVERCDKMGLGVASCFDFGFFDRGRPLLRTHHGPLFGHVS